MPTLSITKFGCIDSADVQLSMLTILIGPQASGKSVISKLAFFFVEVIGGIAALNWEFEETSLDDHKRSISEEFCKRFPPSTWGESAFLIQFTSGPLVISISKSRTRAKRSDVRVVLSDEYSQLYQFSQSEYKKISEKTSSAMQRGVNPQDWSLYYRAQEVVFKRSQMVQGKDFVSHQLFIPAGRAFFTSLGRAIAAFEHGGLLDQVTIRFGRFFLIMRDQLSGRMHRFVRKGREKAAKELSDLQEQIGPKLFSGQIKVERNEEFIQTEDGRKIPFSLLSSGQQELLPLWLSVNGFMDGDSDNALVYIEEPEAHLFPTAQGVLAEYLVNVLSSSPGQRMFMTTHSPYLLAKFDNMLKAGKLGFGSSKKIQAEIEKIIPRTSWLVPGSTTAYAIRDRVVVSLIDEDGLIDADYLDEVSDDILTKLNDLLEIEFS